MHLNRWGKRWLAETICKTVKGEETGSAPADFQHQTGLQTSDSPSSSVHANRFGQMEQLFLVVKRLMNLHQSKAVHQSLAVHRPHSTGHGKRTLSASAINPLADIMIHHLQPNIQRHITLQASLDEHPPLPRTSANSVCNLAMKKTVSVNSKNGIF
ncbi:hypothetical protein J6590_019257 [Homalodisca vitripennis]|nr:hypothetical protein J6590_019257 [Homalodisca vitripennis]